MPTTTFSSIQLFDLGGMAGTPDIKGLAQHGEMLNYVGLSSVVVVVLWRLALNLGGELTLFRDNDAQFVVVKRTLLVSQMTITDLQFGGTGLSV
jgi:hypothetical protein